MMPYLEDRIKATEEWQHKHHFDTMELEKIKGQLKRLDDLDKYDHDVIYKDVIDRLKALEEWKNDPAALILNGNTVLKRVEKLEEWTQYRPTEGNPVKIIDKKLWDDIVFHFKKLDKYTDGGFDKWDMSYICEKISAIHAAIQEAQK